MSLCLSCLIWISLCYVSRKAICREFRQLVAAKMGSYIMLEALEVFTTEQVKEHEPQPNWPRPDVDGESQTWGK